jgi:NAD(P)-dependent dehydrogenase (short-subunit alcohol dehydrogenase family)
MGSERGFMNNKVVIITGASDGIGAEAARQLHDRGAQVVIVGHTEQKAKALARELNVPYYLADFAKLDDVRQLAARLRKDYPRIDVLANNAGGIFGDRTLTIDGHEKTMQVNHLAPFLLTNLLIDILVESKAAVINTSSAANKLLSDFDINDLDVKRKFSPNKAYGNSKLENILFTKELHNRYHAQGISVAAFHPGNVATNFAANSTSPMRFVYQSPFKHLFGLISPKAGADTLVWLASSPPGIDWQSGEYYYKRKPAKAIDQAYDADLAKLLWEKSEQMVSW